MKKDNLYERLKNLLKKSGGGYTILEDKIDLELQLEFYQMVNLLSKKKRPFKEVLEDSKKLYDSKVSDKDKKEIIAELSNTEKVEAYRVIEKFIELVKGDMKQWTILSLQHCRIGLETHLLDEKKIFISTGLGGKNNRLRYFIAIKLKLSGNFTDTRKKLIESELEFSFKSHSSIVEEIKYFDNYLTVIGLAPIDVSINEIIRNSIEECNNYGGFLHSNYLVTNVKVLKGNEIVDHFKKKGIE